MKTIAVVVATYNRLRYLQRSLWCWTRQTFRDFEVIVTDDGGSDDTAEWISANKGRLGFPIRYVRHPDTGYDLAGARNNGVLAANAKRILFTDNDIWWSPRSLEAHAAIKPNQIGVSEIWWLNEAFSKRLLNKEDLPKKEEFVERKNLQHKELRGDIKVPCPDNCWGGAVSYSIELLRHAGGFDAKGFHNKYGFEDIDLAWRLMRSPLGSPGGKARYVLAGDSKAFHIWHPYGPYRGDVPGNHLGGRRIREGYYNRKHWGDIRGKL